MAWTTPTNPGVTAATAAHLNVPLGGSGNTAFLEDNPYCEAYNSAAINISQNTATRLTFDSETADTDGMHSTSTNTGRITVGETGVFMFSAHVSWNATLTGDTMNAVKFRKNGDSTDEYGEQHCRIDTIGTPHVTANCIVNMADGDYMEVWVWNSSSVTTSAVSFASGYSPVFTAVRLAGQIQNNRPVDEWPPVKTYVAGDLATVTDRNICNDRLNYLRDLPAAGGHMALASASSGTRSVTQNSWQSIACDTEDFDNVNMMDGGIVTIPRDGLYAICVNATWEDMEGTAADAFVSVGIRKTLSGELTSHILSEQTLQRANNGADAGGCTHVNMCWLGVGDKVEGVMHAHGHDQNSSRLRNVAPWPSFSVVAVRSGELMTSDYHTWSSPKTWGATELVDAADLNTYERNNTRYIMEVPATHQSRRLTQATLIQMGAHATWEAIPFNESEISPTDFDTGSLHSAVSNSSTITFPETGFFLVMGTVEWGVTCETHSRHHLAIREGGATYRAVMTRLQFGANQSPWIAMSVALCRNFTSGDYVELMVLGQNSGSVQDWVVGSPEFAAIRVG